MAVKKHFVLMTFEDQIRQAHLINNHGVDLYATKVNKPQGCQ